MRSVIFSLILAAFTSQSVLAELTTVADWQNKLNESLEANVRRTKKLLELERHEAHLRHLHNSYPDYYFLSGQIYELNQQIARMRSRIESSLYTGSEMTKDEFVKVLNLILMNCDASIADGKLRIVQRYDGGGSKMVELLFDKGTVKNFTRADVGPDDAVRFYDPRDFTFTALTSDSVHAPWTELFRFDVKVAARLGQDHYALEGNGFVVEGHLLSQIPWKSGELDLLTCYFRPTLKF